MSAGSALSVSPSSSQQVMTLQGTVVDASAVDAPTFFANTRRQNLLFKTISSFAGFGNTDIIPVLQTGIISQITLRIYGTLTVAIGTGTVATTYQWPYNLIQSLRFSANGQSNLINVSGSALKLIANINRLPLDDRGVSNNFGGASPGTVMTQGTLALASESWGVGSGVTGIPNGNYDVELIYEIPVAYDQAKLLGAIFAQTQSTDLEVSVQYNPQASLFTLSGNATVTFSPTVVCEGTVYTIPSIGGGIRIPNLSAFHSLIESRAPNSISSGTNEITLAGQGVGRKLMRLAYRVWNTTGGVNTPLQQNATNFLSPYWRYGGNTTPETFVDGRKLRQFNEGLYNTDIGALWGYGAFDFSTIFAQRDSVDEGQATQLRFGYTIPNSVTLTSPYCEYLMQTIVAGAVPA